MQFGEKCDICFFFGPDHKRCNQLIGVNDRPNKTQCIETKTMREYGARSIMEITLGLFRNGSCSTSQLRDF